MDVDFPSRFEIKIYNYIVDGAEISSIYIVSHVTKLSSPMQKFTVTIHMFYNEMNVLHIQNVFAVNAW